MTTPGVSNRSLVIGEIRKGFAPKRAHPNDAGYDLKANLGPDDWYIELHPDEFYAVPTGIMVDIPRGHVGLVHPRSGMAARHGVTVLNAPGTIDAGFHGEVKVILVNHSDEFFRIEDGDRIAQLVIQKIEHPEPFAVTKEEFEKHVGRSSRGNNGFGSTGK